MDEKIKIGKIEGSADVIRELIKDEDVDLADLMNGKKKVHVSLVMFAVFIVVFFILLVATLLISDANGKIICSMATIIIGIIILCMVYMEWKSKTLICIVSLGETILLALSLGIYTPKDVLKKAENIIETKLEIKK